MHVSVCACALRSLAAPTTTCIAGTDQAVGAGGGGGWGASAYGHVHGSLRTGAGVPSQHSPSSYNRPSPQRSYQAFKSATPRHARAPGYLRSDDTERSGGGGAGATRSAWSIGRGFGGLATWMGGCFGCVRSERDEYVTRENFAATCEEFEALLPSGVLVLVIRF